MNVLFYYRVSGKGQVDGDGQDRQQEKCLQFANANRLTCRGTYFEGAVSGTVEGMTRPMFAKMVAEIERRREFPSPECPPIAAIVVERQDRLARDLMVQEMMFKECRERGIKVFSADRGDTVDIASDGGDPTQVLIRQLMGALAQWERAMLVAKMRVARERKRAAGLRVEGVKPYGFFAGEDQVGALIVAMRDATTPVSWPGICTMLKAEGFKNRKGGDISPDLAFYIYRTMKRREKNERQSGLQPSDENGSGAQGSCEGTEPTILEEISALKEFRQ